MRIHTGFGLLSATLCIGLAMGLASPSQAAMFLQDSDTCLANDTACRLGYVERKLDRLLALMERQRREKRRDGSGRGVDVPVERSCGGSNCSPLAATVCQTGGFARGVPAEVRQDPFTTTLVRATCMD